MFGFYEKNENEYINCIHQLELSIDGTRSRTFTYIWFHVNCYYTAAFLFLFTHCIHLFIASKINNRVFKQQLKFKMHTNPTTW